MTPGTLVACCFFCDKLVTELETLAGKTRGKTRDKLKSLIEEWRTTDGTQYSY